MMRALKQGMVGVGQQTLSPSLTAIGPNRYLTERHFFMMLGIAFIAHLTVIGIASLFPGEKVTDIPVRALTFKIGGADRIAAYGVPTGVGLTTIAPNQPASNTSWRAAPQQPTVTPKPLQPERSAPRATYQPVPIKPAKILPVVPPAARTMPEENRAPALQPLAPMPALIAPPVQPSPAPMPSALPDTTVLTQVASPAIAMNPQRYIREVGAAPQAGTPGAQPNMGQGATDGAVGGQGNENVMTAQTAQTIRERYELQISGWIQQHKLYPAEAGGREGRVVVRMRIDRAGYVRYYALEQSSGVNALDAAAIDMVRRANPVPAVPANYPAGSLIEFLIPITFRVPR